jgi:serine protease Do
VLVARVEPETPAGRAGLEHGDVILEVDGRQIRTTRDLIDYVSGKGPNTRVTLTVLRDGRRLEKEVELGERPGIETAEAERDDERESGIRWLGLDYQELTPNLRNAHGIPAEIAGVFVADVGASSPLFEEGVRPGDVIAEVNGEEVGSIADFERRVQEVRSGGFLRLYVRRFDPRSRRPGAFFAIVRVP